MKDLDTTEMAETLKGKDPKNNTVEVIADPEEESEGKSIAELVSAALLKRGSRRNPRKKPVVIVLKDDAKTIPPNLLALANDEETENVVLTGQSQVKRPAARSLEEYLDSRKIKHADTLADFLDILYEE